MDQKAQALAFLRKDVAQNVHLLEGLLHRNPEILAVSEHGVLLRYLGRLSLASDSVDAARELLQAIPEKPERIVVCRRDVEEYVARTYGLQPSTVCIQTSYLKQMPPPMPEGVDIRPLGLAYHDVVLERYSLFHDPDYITRRLEAGVMYGAFVSGRLAGFIGEHDEGSMGMLEVFPQYRRMGLGYALEVFQIRRILAENRIPYDHVVVTNDKSFHLQEKLGMSFSRDYVTFFGI